MTNSLRCLITAVVLSLVCTGCARDWGPPGPERTETHNIPMDNSDELRVNLNIGAGELRVGSGADNLMEGRFVYNRLRLRPEISYDHTGFRSHLSIREPQHVSASPRYSWDLRFNNSKPLDLQVNFGAGECRMDLGELTLRRVSVQMGVGELKMDLRGTPKQDYSVYVHGGVGEATIYLPETVGVEANVQGGIGDIHASGLQKHDGRYVNDSYGHQNTTIHLDVQGGIGSVHLIAD